MTVFSGRQVVPVNSEAEISQQLLEASLSNDMKLAVECIADPLVDVNYIGAVMLKTKKTELVVCGELPSEVRVEYEEFKCEVTALFLAVHTGNVPLVRRLLSVGADVNQTLFRGYATTAAVRNGHLDILKILLKGGASQPACEEALLEASCHGQARLVELLMSSDQIRAHVAVHSLVIAGCRGFSDVVDALMKCGVDTNATDRVLLQSLTPCLHANVDCTALVATIVSRQISVFHMLLKAGARTDIEVRLGAWSWDVATGEEFRVGAGLAEPYAITWCAVEYFESSGTILRMLLELFSPNAPHCGRTLLHHAILCGNSRAVEVLLKCGANIEVPVTTTSKVEFRPIHMAARLGLSTILQLLIEFGCDINSRTDSGDTALMICAKYRHEECLKVLAIAGADFGLVNSVGQSASSIAATNRWSLGFQQALLDAIRVAKIPRSSNFSIFSPLIFVAEIGNADALKTLICWGGTDLDYQDDNGFSAAMIAALKGHVEAFRLLVYAGADVKLTNKSGETAIMLSKLNQKRDLFEKVMLEFALEKGNYNAGGFYALHCAARRGDLDALKSLTKKGYDVNVPDGDGHTPLMLAAREGHGHACQFLILRGARCDIKNSRGETALSLAKSYGSKANDAEHVILDELARQMVLHGSQVQKYTKGGKGGPHIKEIKMVGAIGVLRWGKSSKRNVICREAEIGPSHAFCRNRQNKGDADRPGIFRVVTNRKKEVHFVCDGGLEMAKLWVRGIKLVTKEAICDKILDDVLDALAYRILAYILLGVVRIYSRKVEYLFTDCNNVLSRINDFVVSGKGKLLIESKRVPFNAIERPKRFELDAFDLEIADDAIGDDNDCPEEIDLRDGARKYKHSSSSMHHCMELSASRVTRLSDCTLVDLHSSRPEEIHMEVDTWRSQSSFEMWKGNLQERFCEEESMNIAKISEIHVSDTDKIFSEDAPNNNLKIPETTQQQESSMDHIQEEDHDLNNLEQSIEKLLGNGHPVEQLMDGMVLGTGNKLIVSGNPSIEEPHIDLEQMELLETPMSNNEKVTVASEGHQETPNPSVEEPCIDLEQMKLLEISMSNNEKFTVASEGHQETPNPTFEEARVDLEQMKLPETPVLHGEKVAVAIESHQQTLHATPQFRSQSHLSAKCKSRAGGSALEFMFIPTPSVMERARTSRKRKCVVDSMTVLPNEVLKQSIHDSSDLVRKRRKAQHIALASWKSGRLANLSHVLVEPLVPCMSSELKSLYGTEKLNISVSVESGEASEKTYSPVTPTSSRIKQQTGTSSKKPQAISGIEKVSQISQEGWEVEASRDIDMSKSPSSNKSVEGAGIAPETPMSCFRSLRTIFESPDSFTNINLDRARHGSLYESMEKHPDNDHELDLASTDKGQKTVEGSNNYRSGERSSRTRAVAKNLQRNYILRKQQGADEVLNMLQLAEGKTKKENARLFYDILVLKGKGCVDVKQEKAYDDILISKLPALDRTCSC